MSPTDLARSALGLIDLLALMLGLALAAVLGRLICVLGPTGS